MRTSHIIHALHLDWIANGPMLTLDHKVMLMDPS